MTNVLTTLAPGDAVQLTISRVLDGAPLREALRDAGLSPQQFQTALAKDKAAAIAYARATELRADLLADEALHIADTQDDAAKARNQIQVRQWLASKLYAKRYGDRIDLNVTQTLDVGATLAEARARLLPTRYPSEVIEGQAIEITEEKAARISDNQSLDTEPDIFS